jgi:two-component system OmpR family response regulator
MIYTKFSEVYIAEHILFVDDESMIVEILKDYLERDGFRVSVAYDGQSALDMAKSTKPDLMILDLMLPKVSGWDVCRSLRNQSGIPIIMLTARDDVTEKIIGLELGADDYITKPFDPKEVVSRVRAVLRRASGQASSSGIIKIGGLIIDPEKRLVTSDGNIIELTPIEFDLLKVMASSPGRVYSRMRLLDLTQGDAYEGYERTIDSHIKNLRKKIEKDPVKPTYIITVYGVGYKMEDV